jgi:hypothetical protein
MVEIHLSPRGDRMKKSKGLSIAERAAVLNACILVVCEDGTEVPASPLSDQEWQELLAREAEAREAEASEPDDEEE